MMFTDSGCPDTDSPTAVLDPWCHVCWYPPTDSPSSEPTGAPTLNPTVFTTSEPTTAICEGVVITVELITDE